MDIATLVNALNTNFNQVQAQDRRKVITDEDGQDRIVLGKQDDGTYAIRVSDTGSDVGAATDDQLVMNSDWNMWKIIHSGTTQGIPGSTKRVSGITINSTNIGYVADICIPIRNLKTPLASVFSYTSKPQIFLRSIVSKRDLNYTTVFYDDGTNKVDVNYSYFLRDKYLIVRTTLRWRGGSVSFAPASEVFDDGSLYWEIANPTRIVPGGMGGGGTPTGKYVYYDSVTANPYTNVLSGYDNSFNAVDIAPQTFSSVYSYTFQFADNNQSFHFPGSYNLPVLPAVDVTD